MVKPVKLNRQYEVTYLAGSSKDGDTIYVDRRLPETLTLQDGRVINTDHFLLIHEVVEKSLTSKLGYIYAKAHLMAEAAERFACHTHGVPWDEYQTFMELWIEKTAAEGYTSVPPDLDIKPEIDSKDESTLKTFLGLTKGKYKIEQK